MPDQFSMTVDGVFRLAGGRCAFTGNVRGRGQLRGCTVCDLKVDGEVTARIRVYPELPNPTPAPPRIAVSTTDAIDQHLDPSLSTIEIVSVGPTVQAEHSAR
jgi:hypothetical protein